VDEVWQFGYRYSHSERWQRNLGTHLSRCQYHVDLGFPTRKKNSGPDYVTVNKVSLRFRTELGFIHDLPRHIALSTNYINPMVSCTATETIHSFSSDELHKDSKGFKLPVISYLTKFNMFTAMSTQPRCAALNSTLHGMLKLCKHCIPASRYRFVPIPNMILHIVSLKCEV
jgi:hypothetical protein